MRTTLPLLPKSVQRQWLQFLSKRKEVQSAVIFGSRARGDAERRSDIDISISAPEASNQDWLEISTFLEEKTPSLLPVDVVRWENSSTTLRKKIRKEGRVIYERR